MLIGGSETLRFSGLKINHHNSVYHTIDLNSKKSIITGMTTSNMQEQRNNCKTAVIGSKVYCFGGLDSNRRELQSIAENLTLGV